MIYNISIILFIIHYKYATPTFTLEIVLDALTKKGQHAEHFVAFAHNPKLLARFQERMNEYRRSYINNNNNNNNNKLYI